MVSKKTRRCETVKPDLILWTIRALTFMAILLLSLAIILWLSMKDSELGNGQLSGPEFGEDEEDSDEEDDQRITSISFQNTINQWVANVSGNKGVLIYDLDLDAISGSYNANTEFPTASLYKLFVVYEGYRRIQGGEWQETDLVGYTGYTIQKCLDLAIRESNSACAETLWRMIGYDELDRIVQEDFGLEGLSVGRLSATPIQISVIMENFYHHSGIEDESLVNKMKDSFLNQPKTVYDWRQGLPSGFSQKVLVYDKVGWEYGDKVYKIYNDAAIVDFIDAGRTFIIVVMTNRVSPAQIRQLGSEIERTFYTQYEAGQRNE